MTRPEKKTERIWCVLEKSMFDVIHQISIQEDRSLNGTLRMLAREAIAARQQKITGPPAGEPIPRANV